MCRQQGEGTLPESIGARFGAVICRFCGREFDHEKRIGPRFLIEPDTEPGLYRARCRVACSLMPFVTPGRR